VADNFHGLHGTGQIIITFDRGLMGSTFIQPEVLAAEDGLDPKHLERYPRASLSRDFKPFTFDFCRLFAAKDIHKLRHSIEHELRVGVCNIKEDDIILGLSQGSEIILDGLVRIVRGLDHSFDCENVLAVQLCRSVNLRQVIQELTGRGVRWEGRCRRTCKGSNTVRPNQVSNFAMPLRIM